METAADAARHFAEGPQVVQAAQLLLERFPLPVLCEALANARPQDVDGLVQALERLVVFEEIRTAFLSDDVVGFFRDGASAPDARIRRLAVQLLVQLAKGEAGAARLVELGVLETCETLLLDDEVGIAEAATRVLLGVAQWPAGRVVVTGGDDGGGVVQRLLGKVRVVPDVPRIRLLHFFVELGRSSEEIFAAVKAQGAYREVLGEFLTDDLLLKLNAVELMDALGSFPAGQILLSQEGVPAQLVNQLADPMNDFSIQLCVLRLLGFVLLHTPEMMGTLLPSREAPLAQTMAAMIENRDPAAKLCAMNAWANASMHSDGRTFFVRWPEMFGAVIGLAASPQNEVCKEAMACWAAVLQSVGPAPEGEVWVKAEEQLVPLVLKNLTGKPFPDVRCPTWRLLAVLVSSRSVAQRVLTSEQIYELLFDFGSETASEPRIAKYEFVSALMRHHGTWLAAFLDEKLEQLLAELVRQGPHWVPVEAKPEVGQQSG